MICIYVASALKLKRNCHPFERTPPAAMAGIPLYDSTICRLCAEDNDNGEILFADDNEKTDLSAMVNRYLPLKVFDDGKLPRTICPGCNIQLEATIQFFELLINGQEKIRNLYKQQQEIEHMVQQAERKSFKSRRIDFDPESSKLIRNEDENLITKSNEQEIIINVMADGTLYAGDHDISLQMKSLEKPRKKRGRPPKFTEEEVKETDKADEFTEGMSIEEEDKPEEEIDGDGRRRRKRKVPKRYLESVQGKELEKIFKDQDVFDENKIQIKYDSESKINGSSADSSNSDTEIIGHLETIEGKNLGELIVVNRNKIRAKARNQKNKTKQKYKFVCSYCGKGFFQRSKYITHRSLHKIICFECTECQNQFFDKELFIDHQKTLGHTGERICEVDGTLKGESDNPKEIVNEESDNIADMSEHVNISNVINDSVNSLPDEENNSESSKEEVENGEDSFIDNEMAQDQNSNEGDNSFKCDKCNKHFQSKDNLENHIKVVHQGKKPFVCEVCSKAFAYESSLKGHKEIVHQSTEAEKGFLCDICGKVFNHPSSVMYHKSTEHNTGRRFVCNKCGKSFKHKQLLQRHQLVHSEDRPYPCKSCNASFKTKANLLNHQSTHTGEKKHCCELCDHKFAHKTSLTLHYRTHTGQKPYKCDICSKSFSQNGNLQEHMRIHTGEKPYCCDHCGRKFTTSSQFKLHVKRHTGERPWKCEFCEKSFLHKDTWKCHVRRHTGERPFQCPYCNRGFTEQWALKKHLRLHTGEKPYSCEICGKAFADCSNLTKHKRIHKVQKHSNNTALVREVWHVLPDSQEENTNSFNDVNQIVTEEGNGEEIPQIIYVAYQDPDNSNASSSLNFNKEDMISDQETNLNATEETEDPIHTDFSEGTDLQLHITDEDGNAIPISIQEAQRLLSGEQLVSQLGEGQTIRIHGLSTPDGLHSEPEMKLASANESVEKNSTTSTIQTDAEAIVKALEDEDTDATVVAAINQMNTEDKLELAAGQQAIEFITQDGQKVRVVTSMNVDPMQLASQYLTIV